VPKRASSWTKKTNHWKQGWYSDWHKLILKINNSSCTPKKYFISWYRKAIKQTWKTLVSFQYGYASNETADLKKNHKIDVMEASEIDIYNDLDVFSALISVCDYMVSIDKATIHLAEALGAYIHVLLPTNRDWRWG